MSASPPRSLQGFRVAAAVAVGLAVLAAPAAPAQAQNPRAAEAVALARDLFRQGVELADRGEWAEAVDRFRRSYQLRPAAATAYNLGRALTHTGELVEATELLRLAANNPRLPERMREEAEQELQNAEVMLSRITLTIEGDPDGAELLLDGEPVLEEMVGVEVPVDPGIHTLSARRGGEEVASATVTLASGETGALSIEVPPPAVPSPSEVAAGSVEGAGPGPALDEGGGDDGGAIAAGVILGLLAVGAAAAVLCWYFLIDQNEAEPIPGNLMPGTVEFP